ncbi:MAG TPA: YraN family protein [Steroidobacteraceae bacterium]|nr:YraN family protein [Steroidobacteraceae bacterium]
MARASSAPATPPERQRLGRDAEERAAQYLQAAGLLLLHRNYRCRMGELDLVAREAGTLVIAEVRLRSSSRFGGAAASITHAKRRRIVLATRHLLARYPSLQKWPVRFDALLVGAPGGPIEWLRGAFDAC